MLSMGEEMNITVHLPLKLKINATQSEWRKVEILWIIVCIEDFFRQSDIVLIEVCNHTSAIGINEAPI